MSIIKAQGVCGGRPIIKGTRIEVDLIKNVYNSYADKEEAIRHMCEDYSLEEKDVLEALEYVPKGFKDRGE